MNGSARLIDRSATRHVAMLAFEQVQILDVTGPLEVFARASRWLGEHRRRARPAYSVEVIGTRGGSITTSSGLTLFATRGIDEIGEGIDTLMVAGGVGIESCCGDPRLISWLCDQADRVRRLSSVCTGSFLLAEAGLLHGRIVTTHWNHCDALARRHPDLQVEQDRLFVHDGGVYTSAGVTAGMDLALSMVEEDHGRDVALATARELVLCLQRPGSYPQLSPQLRAAAPLRSSLRSLQDYIHANPAADLCVASLAARASMSPRSLARQFVAETGISPARYVTAVRMDHARRLLEESNEPLERICARTGMGSTEALRRSFLRTIGISPRQYRQRLDR